MKGGPSPPREREPGFAGLPISTHGAQRAMEHIGRNLATSASTLCTLRRHGPSPRTGHFQGFALGDGWPARLQTVAGAPFSKRQPLAVRRHHPTTNCGELVTEAAVRLLLLLCADAARRFSGLDDASSSHQQIGPVDKALPALKLHVQHAMLFCLHAFLCVRVARMHVACMHTVLRCFCSCLLCRAADHAGGAVRCHDVRVVRAGPTLRPQPGIRGGSGRDCKRGGGGMGGAVPKRWRVTLSVACYVLYMCRPAMLPGCVYLHALLAPAHVLGCYHEVARIGAQRCLAAAAPKGRPCLLLRGSAPRRRWAAPFRVLL
jgi:hypothetical protein